MGYVFVFLAFAFIGTYLVPLRFSRVKGDAYLALMGLGLWAALLGLAPFFKELVRHPLWLVAGVSAGVFWAIAQSLANRAVEEISLAKAVVVFNLNSFVNMAVGFLLFQEVSGWKTLLILSGGSLLLFGGASLVASAQAVPTAERNLRKGILLAAGAGLIWGVYFVPLQAVQRWAAVPSLGPLHLLSGLAAGGGATALIMGWKKLRTEPLRGQDLAWGMASGFVWVAGTAFFLLAIAQLGLARAVPLINTNTLMYTAWSLFVFRELPSSQMGRVILGAILVVLGAGFFAFA